MDSVGIQDYLKEVHDLRMSKSNNGRRRKLQYQDARRDLSLYYICFVAYHVAYLRSLDRRTKFFVAAYFLDAVQTGRTGQELTQRKANNHRHLRDALMTTFRVCTYTGNTLSKMEQLKTANIEKQLPMER